MITEPRGLTLPLLACLLLCVPALGSQNLAPPALPDGVAAQGAPDCTDGVVKDDGTIESGYGWVPSVVDGRYVQRFEHSEFRSRKIEEVCVCWTRTRADEDVTFLVQLYRDRGGRPARDPEVSVEAVATMVPTFPDGAFYSIDVSGVDMRAVTNTFYLGVQWNPSQDDYFFVCVDQTETTPIVDGWFVDDRAADWTSVLESTDPIFDDHRAMMIRARAAEGYYALVPTLGGWGIAVLALVIAGLGVVLLRLRTG